SRTVQTHRTPALDARARHTRRGCCRRNLHEHCDDAAEPGRAPHGKRLVGYAPHGQENNHLRGRPAGTRHDRAVCAAKGAKRHHSSRPPAGAPCQSVAPFDPAPKRALRPRDLSRYGWLRRRGDRVSTMGKMMFHSRTSTTIFAVGSVLALSTATAGDYAHAQSNLDASYTISFARMRVGDIAATIVFGDREYNISARGRAGGIIKLLL